MIPCFSYILLQYLVLVCVGLTGPSMEFNINKEVRQQ